MEKLDWGTMVNMVPKLAQSVYSTTGGTVSVAGRISFALGLQGPCIGMDVACSSALVAAHVASAQSARRSARMRSRRP